MNRLNPGVIVLSVILITTNLYADESLDEKYSRARAQSDTLDGYAYDQQLGNYLNNIANLSDSMDKCLNESSGSRSIYGVFEFTSYTDYKLLLTPESAFSECIKGIFEGRSLPLPPSVPYLSPFIFTSAK